MVGMTAPWSHESVITVRELHAHEQFKSQHLLALDLFIYSIHSKEIGISFTIITLDLSLNS